jgi:Uma2 family endonuclease
MSVLFDSQHRFTVDDVFAMLDHGALDRAEHVQLLDGVLVDSPPQGFPHLRATSRIHRLLIDRLGPTRAVLSQGSLLLPPDSMPEPDVAVLLRPITDYSALPRGTDCLLVVEVAVTSHALDVHKARLYAAGGVPCYWLVDVPGRRVLVHELPRATGYHRVTTWESGEAVPLPEGGGHALVDDLL